MRLDVLSPDDILLELWRDRQRDEILAQRDKPVLSASCLAGRRQVTGRREPPKVSRDRLPRDAKPIHCGPRNLSGATAELSQEESLNLGQLFDRRRHRAIVAPRMGYWNTPVPII